MSDEVLKSSNQSSQTVLGLLTASLTATRIEMVTWYFANVIFCSLDFYLVGLWMQVLCKITATARKMKPKNRMITESPSPLVCLLLESQSSASVSPSHPGCHFQPQHRSPLPLGVSGSVRHGTGRLWVRSLAGSYQTVKKVPTGFQLGTLCSGAANRLVKWQPLGL